MYAIRSYARITSYNVCYTKLLRNGQYMRMKTDAELLELVWPFLANSGILGSCAPGEANSPEARAAAGLRFADHTLLEPTAEQRAILLKAMPLARERLHFLTDAPQVIGFLFTEPAVPPLEEILPRITSYNVCYTKLLRSTSRG